MEIIRITDRNKIARLQKIRTMEQCQAAIVPLVDDVGCGKSINIEHRVLQTLLGNNKTHKINPRGYQPNIQKSFKKSMDDADYVVQAKVLPPVVIYFTKIGDEMVGGIPNGQNRAKTMLDYALSHAEEGQEEIFVPLHITSCSAEEYRIIIEREGYVQKRTTKDFLDGAFSKAECSVAHHLLGLLEDPERIINKDVDYAPEDKEVMTVDYKNQFELFRTDYACLYRTGQPLQSPHVLARLIQYLKEYPEDLPKFLDTLKASVLEDEDNMKCKQARALWKRLKAYQERVGSFGASAHRRNIDMFTKYALVQFTSNRAADNFPKPEPVKRKDKPEIA